MSFINPLVFNRFDSAFCKFVTDSVSSVIGQNRHMVNKSSSAVMTCKYSTYNFTVNYGNLAHTLASCQIRFYFCFFGSGRNPPARGTTNSADFHAHLGYTKVGKFQKCGYKFGRWYNMIWMEKLIGEHKNQQAPVLRFTEESYER